MEKRQAKELQDRKSASESVVAAAEAIAAEIEVLIRDFYPHSSQMTGRTGEFVSEVQRLLRTQIKAMSVVPMAPGGAATPKPLLLEDAASWDDVVKAVDGLDTTTAIQVTMAYTWIHH